MFTIIDIFLIISKPFKTSRFYLKLTTLHSCFDNKHSPVYNKAFLIRQRMVYLYIFVVDLNLGDVRYILLTPIHLEKV